MARKWCASGMAVWLLCASCQTLHRGDLLFHVCENDNPITTVTPGMIDHVAVYAGHGRVVEAFPPGVVMTRLDSVLHREAGHYVAGRVKHLARRRSLQNAMAYLGRPYDHLFLPNNEAIYCSELVQLAFVDKRGERIFAPIPMSFHDDTGVITPYWRQFYAEQGLEVPEGESGTNPSELSQRPAIRLFPLGKSGTFR